MYIALMMYNCRRRAQMYFGCTDLLRGGFFFVVFFKDVKLKRVWVLSVLLILWSAWWAEPLNPARWCMKFLHLRMQTSSVCICNSFIFLLWYPTYVHANVTAVRSIPQTRRDERLRCYADGSRSGWWWWWLATYFNFVNRWLGASVLDSHPVSDPSPEAASWMSGHAQFLQAFCTEWHSHPQLLMFS